MSAELAGKVKAAMEMVDRIRPGHVRPVIYCSFGKDSMTLLHLLRSMGLSFPVIFHREPFMPHKYVFANRIIKLWNLTVYDYPPLSTAVVKRGNHMELVNYYQTGWSGNKPYLTYLPTGITEFAQGQEFLCGRDDLLRKPTGNFQWPWDLALIGHKSSDTDIISGAIPLHADVHQTRACHLAFPLRDFTDKDVWDYQRIFNVPYQKDRYDKANGFAEFPNRTNNPDYFEACTACIDRDAGAIVHCPKLGMSITNMSGEVPYVSPPQLAYFGNKEEGTT